MTIIGTHMSDQSLVVPYLPQTVKEAVERIISELSLRDRAEIAKMEGPELVSL